MTLCTVCNKEFKNLGSHRRMKHTSPEVPLPSPAPKQEKVRFISTQAQELIVIVVPAFKVEKAIPGPTGVPVFHYVEVPGKMAEFHNGAFETDDPEIINHFKNIYKDHRYPVVYKES